VFSGSANNEGYGIGIGTPDLNGDGLADLLAGSALGSSVFYGPLSGDFDTSQADATIGGSSSYSSAQFSPGDLNLDGYDDWLVGDSTGIYLFLGAEN
jgi:hypothetical protein